jgi:putative mRNA 3-end processing factor
MLEKRKEGLYFPPGDFYLDPYRNVARAVISHAHADHAIPGNQEVWSTDATWGMMKLRYKDRLKSKFNSVAFRDKFEINGVKIQLFPAGHMLGSAQIVIDHEGVKYCYTGDYKMRADASCEPFEVVPCDVLITETTFADPSYSHPTEEDEMAKLLPYDKTNLVIGAYNLGKAQRLTLLLNQFFPERRIMVHPEAAGYHRFYEQQGISLGKWQHYNYQLFRRTTGNILIAPPRTMSTYLNEARVVTAFATGWKKSPFRSHFNFHLSDHADWQEILNLVKLTGAKKIITVHGDGTALLAHLKHGDYQLQLFDE